MDLALSTFLFNVWLKAGSLAPAAIFRGARSTNGGLVSGSPRSWSARQPPGRRIISKFVVKNQLKITILRPIFDKVDWRFCNIFKKY